LCTHRRSK